MQKVYKKLLAHPLFVSVYVVYYARVGADVRMCVCVCYTIIWIDQINGIKRYKERRFSLQRLHAICNRLYVHGRNGINFYEERQIKRPDF